MSHLFAELSPSLWTGAIFSETISNSTCDSWKLHSTRAENRLAGWWIPSIRKCLQLLVKTSEELWSLCFPSSWHVQFVQVGVGSWRGSTGGCWLAEDKAHGLTNGMWWLLFSSRIHAEGYLNGNGVSQGLELQGQAGFRSSACLAHWRESSEAMWSW